jgi:hypothetical protein
MDSHLPTSVPIHSCFYEDKLRHLFMCEELEFFYYRQLALISKAEPRSL